MQRVYKFSDRFSTWNCSQSLSVFSFWSPAAAVATDLINALTVIHWVALSALSSLFSLLIFSSSPVDWNTICSSTACRRACYEMVPFARNILCRQILSSIVSNYCNPMSDWIVNSTQRQMGCCHGDREYNKHKPYHIHWSRSNHCTKWGRL